MQPETVTPCYISDL